MSKSLLNLLLQISKALVYSKIKSLFGKEFPFTFGPIGPVASRPIRPFSPVVAHLPSPPCRPTGQPAQWPSTGPPGFSHPSLADVRAPLVIFFPEPAAEHCRPSRPGRAHQAAAPLLHHGEKLTHCALFPYPSFIGHHRLPLFR
jgi:hypothetical protein